MPVVEAPPSVAFSYSSLSGLRQPVSEHFSGHMYSSLRVLFQTHNKANIAMKPVTQSIGLHMHYML